MRIINWGKNNSATIRERIHHLFFFKFKVKYMNFWSGCRHTSVTLLLFTNKKKKKVGVSKIVSSFVCDKANDYGTLFS